MYDGYFQGIIGHGAIKQKLIRWLERDRMPHAVIFAGPGGIGKTMMACAAASAMAGRTVHIPWEEKADKPVVADRDDVYYLAPAGAMLKVDQFRQLQQRLMLRARPGSRRICIIDHVETMNAEFANTMLKTLEEPPADVCFILITNQPSLLLPTIISRCAIVYFEPVGDEELVAGLVALRGGQAASYADAVSWGNGIVRTVLSYLDGAGPASIRQALDFLHIMASHPCPYAKWLTVSANDTERDTADILRWTSLFLRDMLVLRSGAEPSLLRLRQYQRDMTELLPYWTDAGRFAMLQVFEEAAEAVTRHVNTRLIWDYVCIRCIQAKGGI